MIVQPALAASTYTLLAAWNGSPTLDRPDAVARSGDTIAGRPSPAVIPSTRVSPAESDPATLPVDIRTS